MECYERTKINMTIKTFRGLMQPDTIDTVSLHTNDGSIGYRIVKFQTVGQSITGTSHEAVLKIWKVPQTATSYTIDLSDQTLLAVIFNENNSAVAGEAETIIIFDHEIVNQDIYITCASTGGAMNYYIELEQMSLDLNENTVATLKDIRNSTNAITS